MVKVIDGQPRNKAKSKSQNSLPGHPSGTASSIPEEGGEIQEYTEHQVVAKKSKSRAKDCVRIQAAEGQRHGGDLQEKETDQGKKEKKRKRARNAIQTGPQTTRPEQVVVGTSSSGERKRRKQNESDGCGDARETHDTVPRTTTIIGVGTIAGHPNPDFDLSLTEQARKALLYAFAYTEQPSSWKFNKARQNWLLRNYWSDQSVPDTYSPLVFTYLCKVRGGVRKTLMEVCEKITSQPSQDAVQPPVGAGDTAETNTAVGLHPASEVKQQRARELLAAFAADVL